jgi:hypothetical protein
MNDSSRGRNPGHRPVVDPSTTDRGRLARSRARVRLREQDRRRAICREAERLMPLARYYGPQPLLAVPIGHYYVRGRWAA